MQGKQAPAPLAGLGAWGRLGLPRGPPGPASVVLLRALTPCKPEASRGFGVTLAIGTDELKVNPKGNHIGYAYGGGGWASQRIGVHDGHPAPWRANMSLAHVWSAVGMQGCSPGHSHIGDTGTFVSPSLLGSCSRAPAPGPGLSHIIPESVKEVEVHPAGSTSLLHPLLTVVGQQGAAWRWG